LENFIKRHGEIEGPLKYKEYIKKIAHTLENFIKRHGEIEGPIKYKECNKKRVYSSSLAGFIDRYGEIEGEARYKESNKKRVYSGWGASKESFTNLFNPIIEKLGGNYTLYYGKDDVKEWFIWDNVKKKYNLFDFYIKEVNIIIEYHGSLWHYNKDIDYTEDKFGPKVEDMIKKDTYKRELALSKGFEFIEVFDTDNFEEKINYILDLINKKVKYI